MFQLHCDSLPSTTPYVTAINRCTQQTLNYIDFRVFLSVWKGLNSRYNMPYDHPKTSLGSRDIGGDDYYETSSSDGASDNDEYGDEICPKDPGGCDCPDRGRSTYRDCDGSEHEKLSNA